MYRTRGGKKRTVRRRRGGKAKSITGKILRGIGNYKKIMGAIGLRKGAASLGKLAVGTGLRMAKNRASMMM